MERRCPPYIVRRVLTTASIQQVMMRDAVDAGDRLRLERHFAAERAMSSERIMKVTASHEFNLHTRMRQLGLSSR